MLHDAQKFMLIKHENAITADFRPVQPSSARNSASTIAVAPQISWPQTRKAGTTYRTPSRSRLVRTKFAGSSRSSHRDLEDVRDLAVRRRQQRLRVGRPRQSDGGEIR